MSILTIQVGQCGNQLGCALFSHIAGEIAAAQQRRDFSYAQQLHSLFFRDSAAADAFFENSWAAHCSSAFGGSSSGSWDTWSCASDTNACDSGSSTWSSSNGATRKSYAGPSLARAVLVDTEAKVLASCCRVATGGSKYSSGNDNSLWGSRRRCSTPADVHPTSACAAAAAATAAAAAGRSHVGAQTFYEEVRRTPGGRRVDATEEGVSRGSSSLHEHLDAAATRMPTAAGAQSTTAAAAHQYARQLSSAACYHPYGFSLAVAGWAAGTESRGCGAATASVGQHSGSRSSRGRSADVLRCGFPWCYDEKSCVSATSGGGCSNNFAEGLLVQGPQQQDLLLDKMRRQVESSDTKPTALLLLQSVAGGTGSGLGAYICELCHDFLFDASAAPLINVVSVWPFFCGELAVQSYNACLSLSQAYTYSDSIFFMENSRYESLLTAAGRTPARTGGEVLAFSQINSAMAAALGACALLPLSPAAQQLRMQQQHLQNWQQQSRGLHRGKLSSSSCSSVPNSCAPGGSSVPLCKASSDTLEPRPQAVPMRTSSAAASPLQDAVHSLCAHPAYKLLTCRVLPQEMLLQASRVSYVAAPAEAARRRQQQYCAAGGSSSSESGTAAAASRPRKQQQQQQKLGRCGGGNRGYFVSHGLVFADSAGAVAGGCCRGFSGGSYTTNAAAAAPAVVDFSACETHKSLLRRLQRMFAARSLLDFEFADASFDLRRRKEDAAAAADARCAASARAAAAAAAAAAAPPAATTISSSVTGDDSAAFAAAASTPPSAPRPAAGAATEDVVGGLPLQGGREKQQQQANSNRRNVAVGCWALLRGGGGGEAEDASTKRESAAFSNSRDAAATGRSFRARAGDQQQLANVDTFARALSCSLDFWEDSLIPLTVVEDRRPFAWTGSRSSPRSLCLLSNCQTPLPALQEVLRRVKRMAACRAYVHHYEQHGLHVDQLLDSIYAVEEIVYSYESLGN